MSGIIFGDYPEKHTNSKSEDTPESVSSCHKAPMVVVGGTEGTNHYECTKCNKPCNWVGPQDTSLDEYLIDLVDEHFPKGKSKERGQANVMLAYFVMWHKSEQANLLQVIEDEVVGADDEAGQDHLLSERVGTIRNTLKAEQRQALKQIKERYGRN